MQVGQSQAPNISYEPIPPCTMFTPRLHLRILYRYVFYANSFVVKSVLLLFWNFFLVTALISLTRESFSNWLATACRIIMTISVGLVLFWETGG